MVPFEYHKPQTRASDSERQSILGVLQQHYAEGRLDLEEFELRSANALAARTQGELMPLISDLPVLHASARPSGPPVRHHSGPSAFAVYLRFWIMLNALLVVIYVLTGGWGDYFWPIWPAFGTGIPLALLFAFQGGRSDR